MSRNSDTEFLVNVVMNKEKTKVLYAEANSDFINVLLSFLTMPLGKVMMRAIPIGSICNLFASLFFLDHSHFCVRGAQLMLANPRSSFRAECRKLALDVTRSGPNEYFLCEDPECPKNASENISLYSNIAVCECGRSLNRGVDVGEPPEIGVFTISPLSFVITDDLRVAPILSGTIQTLVDLGITESTQGAEVKTLSFGLLEFGTLLGLCLTSATPLTDMILDKTGVSSSSAAKPEPRILQHNIQKSDSSSRKMALRMFLHKSTNKFLYAEAMDDFVEFLYTFLAIPLAQVEFLFGGNAALGCIDNLYKSVANGIDVKYFTSPDIRNRLINPKLPFGYGSENQFLPLNEDSPPKLYHKDGNFSCHEQDGRPVSSFKSSKITFIKKQTMCYVQDNLALLSRRISILKDVGVTLSDVKEREFLIGMEEALGILKASLTSNTALTDALIKPMLKLEQQSKQEG